MGEVVSVEHVTCAVVRGASPGTPSEMPMVWSSCRLWVVGTNWGCGEDVRPRPGLEDARGGVVPELLQVGAHRGRLQRRQLLVDGH